MSDFESHNRTLIRNGMMIHQTVTVNRITRETAVLDRIKRDAIGGGTLFPFHPELQIAGYKSSNSCSSVLVYLPPRVDRLAIDVSKIGSWPDPDRRFLVAVPARAVFWSFQETTFSNAQVFFMKTNETRRTRAFDPPLFTCLLPNQDSGHNLCPGTLFRNFSFQNLEDVVSATLALFADSGYNADYTWALGPTYSPFGGPVPSDFEVPESLRDVPLFSAVPSHGDFQVLEDPDKLLWFLCRWQAWTEQRLATWQTQVDELCLGRVAGLVSDHWA